MSIEIKEVRTAKDRKEFAKLPYRLYKGSKVWAPPILKDEIHYLDPRYNPALKKFEHKFYLAIRDGKVVGRIGAAINHIYNEKVGKKYVRIIKPEFIDDAEVFDTLVKAVEDFGRERGMELIHGPLGFTNLDTQGLLVEGFEYLQPVASVHHHPYYKEHFERLGFEKENDWIEMRITITEKEVEKGNRILPLIEKRFGLEILKINSMKEVKDKYVKDLFDILNQAFDPLPYVSPFDDELRDFYVEKYIGLLNPKYVKVALKDGEVAGFVLGLPMLTKALQKAKGHLFPFGFIHLIRAMKHPDTLELILTGVRDKYRSLGIGGIVVGELQQQFWKDGGRYFETTGMLEINKAVLANWKQYEQKIQHRRRRCYVKSL